MGFHFGIQQTIHQNCRKDHQISKKKSPKPLGLFRSSVQLENNEQIISSKTANLQKKKEKKSNDILTNKKYIYQDIHMLQIHDYSYKTIKPTIDASFFFEQTLSVHLSQLLAQPLALYIEEPTALVGRKQLGKPGHVGKLSRDKGKTSPVTVVEACQSLDFFETPDLLQIWISVY